MNLNLAIEKHTYHLLDNNYTYCKFTRSPATPPCTKEMECLVLEEKSYIVKT